MSKSFFLGLRTILFYGGMLLGVVWNKVPGTKYFDKVIIFVIGYAILASIQTYILEKAAPEGVKARSVKVKDSRREGKDKILLPLFQVASWFTLIVIPLDLFNWQVFEPMNIIFNVIGAVLIVTGAIVNGISIYTNPFITYTIHDQSLNGQTVVSTGIYNIIRHPFYLGIILHLFGISLWFGSIMSLLVAGVALIILMIRIGIEEEMLKKTLPGYMDYIKSTKYRLVPYVY